jgi:hypothetical protein
MHPYAKANAKHWVVENISGKTKTENNRDEEHLQRTVEALTDSTV